MATKHASNKRLAFIAEWYQEEAAIIRRFIICFYLLDNTIQITEEPSKRIFLRRTKMREISERDFYIGSKINVFGRHLDLIGYADDTTENALAPHREKAFIMIKHNFISHFGNILCAFIESNFSIIKALMVLFTSDQVKTFLGDRNRGDVETSLLMNQLCSGPCIGLQLMADDAVNIIRTCQHLQLEGEASPMPGPLKRLFEREELRSGIYTSQNVTYAAEDALFFFDRKTNLNVTCELRNSTLCIIKPHTIKEGRLGHLVNDITGCGFSITGVRMQTIDRANCQEFYEVYRNLLPEYIPMVAQLASGPSLALELVCRDPEKNTFAEFRKYCGPYDPYIGRILRPNTLRAKFGVSKVMNAVHCTDLPEDTTLELPYIFKILES